MRLATPALPALALIGVFVVLRPQADPQTRAPSGITSETNIDSLIRQAEMLPGTLAEISDSMAKVLDRISTLPVAMPADGWLSSRYANARLHPIRNRLLPHRGIDVAAPTGTPVTAAGAGRVARVARLANYGLLVEIDHGDGLLTRYAHCSRVFVKAGQQISRGERIAAVGSSGLSTGPHLHYEILLYGTAVDPLLFTG